MLRDPCGYGDEARSHLRALELAGHEPAGHDIHPEGKDAGFDEAEARMIATWMKRTPPPGGVAVHHYGPMWLGQLPEIAGRINVQRTMFETDRIPRAWVGRLLTRDEIWVPCEHNREAFERGGIPSERLRVVGGTLDFDVFRPDLEPLPIEHLVPAGHQVFLSAFDFTERKGWRQLLRAWAEAFVATDPVCLLLKVSGKTPVADVRARVEAELDRLSPQGHAPVEIMAGVLSPEEFARLYAACDAYVLPTRGEGWGRPYMEALAVGLPTIASNWSGPTEFMEPETTWLVDGDLVPVPPDHGTFGDDISGHRWFEPDHDALVAALTDVASDPDAARRRAAPARERLIERFGHDATVAALEAALAGAAEREERCPRLGRTCVVRGAFGRTASLAAVNDQLLRGLEAGGRRVHARGPRWAVPEGHGPTVTHSWPANFDPGTEGPTVSILAWELGHPRVDWVSEVNSRVDRVVVYSDYVKNGYVEGGIPAGMIDVIPCGVDLDLFTPEGDRWPLGVEASCVFLFVGGTIWRKGADVLLDAWRRAFGPDDDVALVVKDFGTNSHYKSQNIGAAFRELAADPTVAPVVYLDDEVPFDQLPALYRAADVLVTPYRGEGFCLPVLEAMACGVPAVHTAGGPTGEFSGPAEGWPVPSRRGSLPPETGQPELAGPGYVQELDLGDLIAALRAAAADPADRARRGAAARARALDYDWSVAAERLEAVLQSLEDEALPLARHVFATPLDTRGTSVLYAPDWDDEATWAAALRTWAEAIAASDDVSLVLPMPSERTDELIGRVLAVLDRPEDALPDIVVEAQSRPDLASLVASVDVVVLDERQAAERPPVLCRRARQIVTCRTEDLVELAAAAGDRELLRAA